MSHTIRAAVVSLTLAWAALAPAAPAGEAKLVLVADGQARTAIITAAAEGEAQRRMVETASRVLAAHLRQISGAEVRILAESALGDVRIDGGRIAVPSGKADAAVEAFILVGEGELTRRLGVTGEGLGHGGMLMKMTGNALILLGPYDGEPYCGGTVYAAYKFLESLGCRYLWPGESGKVVPRQRTIAVGPLEVRYTPPLGQRRIRISGPSARNFPTGLARLGVLMSDWHRAWAEANRTESFDRGWAHWNCLGGNLQILAGHAGAGLRGGWAEHGAKHPEWFALQADGTRDQSKAKERWRLCVSNLELVEYVARDIIEQVRQKPDTVCVSLSPNDGGYSSFCMCENCRKLDPPDAPKISLLVFEKVGLPHRKSIECPSLSDRYVWYWNQVAERVTKVHPKLLLSIDAYSAYSTPPVREKLHPNLVVRYVPSEPEGWTGWQQAGAKRAYWRPNNLHSGYQQGTLNRLFARRLAENMAYLVDHGALATDMDSIHNHWATMGMNYYAAARLNWNPKLGYDEILEDYCRSGFGAGADSIKRYFLGVEAISGPTLEKFTPQAVAELGALLDGAEKAAAGDATVRKRVAMLRAGLEFTALSAEAYRLLVDATENRPVDKKAAGALLDRRWLLMRDIARDHPLAVNVAVVAGNDWHLWPALGWRGPSEQAQKAGGAVREPDL